jgi:hypothetical protein
MNTATEPSDSPLVVDGVGPAATSDAGSLGAVGSPGQSVTQAGSGDGAAQVTPRGHNGSLIDDSTITIHSAADVVSRRQQLISYIWGSRGFPSTAMPSTIRDVKSPVANLDNLARVDELDFAMPAALTTGATVQVTTTGYHFIPRSWRKRHAVILHQGHTCTDDDDQSTNDGPMGMWRTLNALLSEGYPVVALFMPYMDAKSCGAQTHGWMLRNIDSSESSPIQYFLEPTARTLNYLQAHYPQYVDYAMVGLSGGGWTTTVYSAIDPRITLGIAVAGSLPLYMRSGWSIGDEEQSWSSFYSIAGYPDLYVMGAVDPQWNRRQVQVLNRGDDCCFGPAEYSTDGLPKLAGRTWNQAVREYESNVQGALSSLGGSFRVEVDEFATVHEISWGTVVNTIMAEIDGDKRDVGAVSARGAFVRGPRAALWYYSRSQGWMNTQMPVVGVPAGIAQPNEKFDVFYRDPSTDGLGLGGSPISPSPVGVDPVAASWGRGRVDVIDLDSKYRLTHWWSTGGAYQMEVIGGRGLGRPTVVTSPGHLDVVVRNFAGGVDHYWSNGSAPWKSESLGGAIVGFPAAVRAEDSLHVYARGVDGAIHKAAKVGDDWQWAAMNASDSFLGSPDALTVDSVERVRARTTNGELGSFVDGTYANLGGAFADSPAMAQGSTWAMDDTGGIWVHDGSTWAAVEAESE